MFFTLEPHEIPFLIVGIVALITMGFQLAFCFTNQTRKSKKPVRFMGFLALLYLVLLDFLIIVDAPVPALGSGLFASIGFILLLIPLIADIIVDWRRK